MSLQSEFSSPWADVLDFPELHQEASQSILQSVEKLRTLARQSDWDSGRPAAILLLGTGGIGKTHLFMRLRQTFKSRAVMVYISPLQGVGMTPRYVLGQIMGQLGRPSFGTNGLRQLDALVAAMMATPLDQSPDAPEVVLSKLKQASPEVMEEIINFFLAQQVQLDPELDLEYFEMLLRLPCMPTLDSVNAMAWLGGRELCDRYEAKLGVNGALSDERIRPALRTLARLAAPRSPLVLVFDQLEALVNCENHLMTAYGNLVSELVNEVRNTVIIQMALTTVWEKQIRPDLPITQLNRIEGMKLDLGLPTPQQAKALLTLWSQAMPDAKPYPWPLSAQTAQVLCESPTRTPRMLLNAMGTALEGSRKKPQNPIQKAWEDAMAWAQEEVKTHASQGQVPEGAFILGGLQTLAQLALRWKTEVIQGRASLGLALPEASLSIFLLSQPNPRSLDAAIKHLPTNHGLALVLREQWMELKPTWTQTLADQKDWVADPKNRWHWLNPEDTTRLLALDSICKAVQSQDIQDSNGKVIEMEALAEWMQNHLGAEQWELTAVLKGEGATESKEGEVAKTNPEDTSVMPPIPPTEAGPLLFLKALRIASLERLQRECRAIGLQRSRDQIAQELRDSGISICWVGENIILFEE